MRIREIAGGLQFPEGSVALDDGSVLVVEIARGTLSRITPNGRIHVIGRPGGGPNGAAIGPDGRICSHIPLPDCYTTNLCFGGRDMRTAPMSLFPAAAG